VIGVGLKEETGEREMVLSVEEVVFSKGHYSVLMLNEYIIHCPT
jgi:hypothetical protein